MTTTYHFNCYQTTLATIAATLKNLKLPLTTYQIYSWAISADPNELLLTRTFCLGVALLCCPTKYSSDDQVSIRTHVLAHMQAIALQLARLSLSSGSGSKMSSLLATSWAAQCALWQLQFLPPDPQRSMILPRLAESMTKRLVEQETSPSAEIQWIYLRALEQQSNFSDMLERLSQLSTEETGTSHPTEFGVALTPNQILSEKARILCALDKFEAAGDIYETLISKSPDDFSCWMHHLECSMKSAGTLERTEKLVEKILETQTETKYPLRGPHLVKIELKARLLNSGGGDNISDSLLDGLAKAIQGYTQMFAARATCCFSDVEKYLTLLRDSGGSSSNMVISLLEWTNAFRLENKFEKSDSDGVRQSKLRAFICSCKITHKLLSKCQESQIIHMPSLQELLEQWKLSLEFNRPAEGDDTQKEIRPDDELLLVIVQQLLRMKSCDPESLVTAATLLEMGMKYSPYNSYLKICAIQVYHGLGAPSRSWELFHAVGLKHIQLDSCTYVILPLLISGGLFNEAIDVCNAMIRFQAGTVRETGDYAGRAMENGTLSKAHEFLRFQQLKMNNSLTMLQAKALILDSAPLLAHPVPRKKLDEDPVLEGGLGIIQGIVGGGSDLERATRMTCEVFNPSAALQIVSWADNGGSLDVEDNRDLSILSYENLQPVAEFETKEEILQASLCCGHTHSLLIRATFFMELMKPPKKGKLVNPTPELEKRATGLLDSCEKCSAAFGDYLSGDEGLCALRKSLQSTMIDLSRTLVMLVSGIPDGTASETLEDREKNVEKNLQNLTSKLENVGASLAAATVQDTFRILAHDLVSLFAIFRKVADALSTFGWGKRKRKTKVCAGVMAELASRLAEIVSGLLSTLDRYVDIIRHLHLLHHYGQIYPSLILCFHS
jgi:N-terminal acetyltransferase B complex non-catalytic subunit